MRIIPFINNKFFIKVITEVKSLIHRLSVWLSGISIRYSLSAGFFRSVKTGLWILMVVLVVIFFLPVIQEVTIRKNRPESGTSSSVDIDEILRQKKRLENSIKRLEDKLVTLIPKSPYLVINTTGNEFYLYRNRKLVRQGVCSTGSYILLESGDEQKWIFKTPKGQFRIQGKTTSPVWKKPDWAFVEEGLPVPPPNHYSRFEYGVLGDYAMSLGYGYLIHGTLYKRFLGLPVTHGCVRLNDDDLEAVYKTLNIGSKVFIY